MKKETRYRMIECTKICININDCLKATTSKNRFVTRLRATMIKLASVVKSLSYSDAWSYLVHRCELVHYRQDLF